MHHNIIYIYSYNIFIYCLHTYTHMHCIIYLQTGFFEMYRKGRNLRKRCKKSLRNPRPNFRLWHQSVLPIEIDPHFRRFLRKSLDISSSPPHLPTHRDTFTMTCIQRSTSSKHLTTDFSGFVWKTQCSPEMFVQLNV